MRLYFIQHDDDGPIKIGIAADPARRLESLQVGNPVALRLLAHRPGALELEMDLHRRLAAFRIRGEWFNAVPDVMAEVEKAAAMQSDDDRYVTRGERIDRRERIEARAVALAQSDRWEEAQQLMSTGPPEDRDLEARFPCI